MLTNGPLAALLAPARARLASTTRWKKIRHKLSLRIAKRHNSGFTGFLRLPTQFDALSGPVIDSVLARRPEAVPLKITVIGCSNGAEAFTIASVLATRRPHVGFEICGYDIDAASVGKAREARYQTGEVLNNKVITQEFLQTTFDRLGDTYCVKPPIAARVTFELGDVLDDALVRTASRSDIVFAQNFLFHLVPRLARRALENVLLMTRPGGAIFLDGTDLDLRQRFVRRRHLLPLLYEIEKIHGEARSARASGWPYCYWGLEPFMTYRRDWARRYATVFLVQ